MAACLLTALSSKPILSPKWCLYYINVASIHVTIVCVRSGHRLWANKSEPSPWFGNSEQWVSDMKLCVDSCLRALSEPWWVDREIFLLKEAEKWGRYRAGGGKGGRGEIRSPMRMETVLGKWLGVPKIRQCWALCAWIPVSSRFLHYHPPMLHRFLEELTQSSLLHALREAVIKMLHFSRKWSTSGAYKCFYWHIAEFWKPTISTHFLVDNLQVLFSFCGGGRNFPLFPRFLQLV